MCVRVFEEKSVPSFVRASFHSGYRSDKPASVQLCVRLKCEFSVPLRLRLPPVRCVYVRFRARLIFKRSDRDSSRREQEIVALCRVCGVRSVAVISVHRDDRDNSNHLFM